MAGLVKLNSYDYIWENLWVGILTYRFEFDVDGWPMKYLGLALGKIQEQWIFFGTLVHKTEKRLDGGREHFLLKEWRLISAQSKKGRNVIGEVGFD